MTVFKSRLTKALAVVSLGISSSQACLAQSAATTDAPAKVQQATEGGSSKSMIFGSIHNDRAIATRCC